MQNKYDWACNSYRIKIRNIGFSFLIHCVGIGFLVLLSGKNFKVNDIVYVIEMVEIPKIEIPKIQQTKVEKTAIIHEKEKNEKSPEKKIETSFSPEKFLQQINNKLADSSKKNFTAKTDTLKYPVTIPDIESTSSINIPSNQDIPIPTRYLSLIKNKIKENWKIERLLSHTSATVSFRLLRNGKVKHVIIEKSSGNPNFDNSSVEAIRETRDFPHFPGEITQNYLDIMIEFSTEG